MYRRTFLATATVTMPLVAGCTGSDGGGGGEEQTTTTTTEPTPTPTTTETTESTPTTTETTTTESPTTETQTTPAPDVTITMRNTAFQTVRAEVETGATVEWVNEDGYGHTVTSAQFHDGAESWSFARQVPGGGSVSHTFDSPGIYEYYCTIHGDGTMCGAVLVGGASLDKSLPCEDDTSDGGGDTDGGGDDDGDGDDDGGYY
ncbi:plastocyanin/azurin family copper-binding protein [Haloferax sp. S1W]|uniref:cupredoxin domain-containing protein n=1 Tax=Haloferax sp. S1W TaxID=3377110 RepID=UPI0037C6793E